MTITVTAAFLIVVILLMFAIIKDLRNDIIYLDYRSQQQFAIQLARERRIHGYFQRAEKRRERYFQQGRPGQG